MMTPSIFGENLFDDFFDDFFDFPSFEMCIRDSSIPERRIPQPCQCEEVCR